MTDLSIDGETFRVEVEGAPQRPTVLLSNALGTDVTLWDAQMPALTEHFRVIRYDSRGHGRSTVAGAPYSLARLGGDALAILDALGVEQTHFIGISMGGAVGQWLLVNAPERISRAVLANTNARLGTPDVWNERIVSVLSGGTGGLAAATMERWFSDGFRAAQVDRVRAIEVVFRATPPEGYAASCAALRDMDLRDALASIRRPVLLVTGRDDAIASKADVAAMTSAIQGVQHVALDCRHISVIEAATGFNLAVVAFLTARTPARLARPRATPKQAAASRRPATRRATSARSPLKASAPDAAAKPRPRRLAVTSVAERRTATKRTPSKVKPRKGARQAAGVNGAAAKKPTTRKPTTKKLASKKLAPKKPAARKTSTRKPSARKAAPKKAVPSKTATAKKTSARKAMPPRRRPGEKPSRPRGGRGR